MNKQVKTALVSVFYKDGLEPLLTLLNKLNVTIYSTGGTQSFIEKMGIPVVPVEKLTTYPSILGGRVKTLHPSVFGGILGRRDNETDQKEMKEYNIPEIDLVIVDLYPFEETVRQAPTQPPPMGEEMPTHGAFSPSIGGGRGEAAIIEKIDIGGPSMIRGAAKNFQDVAVIAAKNDYAILEKLLSEQTGALSLEQRRAFAAKAFEVVAHYDIAIYNYFNPEQEWNVLNEGAGQHMRYGENPHQQANFYGDLSKIFTQLHGKEISYNNLVDIDAAIQLIREFSPPGPHPTSPNGGGEARQSPPPLREAGRGLPSVFAIIKHTNVCGIAMRPNLPAAWDAALAGDPESAFGGVLICNAPIDKATADAINEIFFEVLIAPSFEADALTVLETKKNRILLQLKASFILPRKMLKMVLGGSLVQDMDEGNYSRWEEAGGRETTAAEKEDLSFANIVCKHLKSNAIALVKDKQLIGKGCGQTSRVDALRMAIEKAKQFKADIKGAVLASDAFFPFSDSVQMAHTAGISAFIQPGGSVRDKDSIEYCRQHKLAMVLTGMRHFKH